MDIVRRAEKELLREKRQGDPRSVRKARDNLIEVTEETTPTHEFWIGIRHALLIALGALEKMLKIEPTTSDLRNWWKDGKIGARS